MALSQHTKRMVTNKLTRQPKRAKLAGSDDIFSQLPALPFD
jgi:hypothetical protein